jgi:hypothetical protein
MSVILGCLMAGLVGTAVMTVFLFIPAWMGWGRLDVVRAAGSLVTHNRETALMPGLAIHFSAGAFFALFYWGFLHSMHMPLNAGTGLFLGMIHGALISLLVTIIIMEHHPLQRYHDRGPMTGVGQLLGHLLYGLTVGLMAQMLHL